MKSILLRGRAFRLALVAATTVLLIGAIMGGISLAQGLGGSDDNNDGDVGASESAPSATFGSPQLTVQVDQTYCATVGVQCTQAGDTFAEALPSNHNLVRMGIQVLRLRGKPVTGLSESAFVIISDFVPAGGSAVVKASCTDCFKEAGSNKGSYVIFVNPSSGNWKSGSYFVQVQVTVPTPNGTRSHLALAQVDIPFV